MDRKVTKKKYRLTCTAPNELSVYDEERNQSIHKECWRLHKFDVGIECYSRPLDGLPCPYLDVKGYK